MHKRLKFIDGTADKFWEINVEGSLYTVTFGRNGTSGVMQSKSFDSAEECLKVAEKLLAEKIKKGYSEDGTVSITPTNSAVSSPKTDKKDQLAAIFAEYDKIIEFKAIHKLLPFCKKNPKEI
jgi:predicted DNA-binding WGR domain protein